MIFVIWIKACVSPIQIAISALDKMIGAVDAARAGLGAIQNNRHPLWC